MNAPTDRVISIGYVQASEPDSCSTSFPWAPGDLREAFLDALVSDDDVTDVWYRVSDRPEAFSYSSIVCIVKGDPTRPIQ